ATACSLEMSRSSLLMFLFSPITATLQRARRTVDRAWVALARRQGVGTHRRLGVALAPTVALIGNSLPISRHRGVIVDGAAGAIAGSMQRGVDCRRVRLLFLLLFERRPHAAPRVTLNHLAAASVASDRLLQRVLHEQRRVQPITVLEHAVLEGFSVVDEVT